MTKAWCKHTPETPCAYCQDKHDEHQWAMNISTRLHDYWLERKQHLAKIESQQAAVIKAAGMILTQDCTIASLRAQTMDQALLIGRMHNALTKIYTYRSDDPDWNMVMAIAGEIVEPMTVIPSTNAMNDILGPFGSPREDKP